MRLEELDYELPPELIAQEPIEPRDHARLMVLNRHTGAIAHRRFYELGDYLQPGDVLVINDTKVIRARLRGKRADTGGQVEVLLLRPDDHDDYVWRVLIKPGRRARTGGQFVFGCAPLQVTASVEGRLPDGSFAVRFDRPRGELLQALDTIGEVPLPPYIKTPLTDDRPYQTVYAREPGSGRTFDWERAAAWRGHPRLVVAGGLTPANVAAAIAALRPYAVDVSTGVEAAPGVKDRRLIEGFVRAARGEVIHSPSGEAAAG